MRHVAKGEEPESLLQWKTSTPGASWAGLRTDLKREALKVLVTEQKGLCCYCEGSLMPGQRTHGPPHIEHLVPRNPPQSGLPLSAEWTNWLASCTPSQAEDTVGAHCGEKKADRRIPINPLQPDCADHFEYTRGGDVVGTGPSALAAQETISTLNLNEINLKKGRVLVIAALADHLEAGDDPSRVLEPRADGTLPTYYSALRATLRRLT